MLRLLFIFCLMMHIQFVIGQLWNAPENKQHSIIPFEFVNNLIIVSVQLNNEPLSFILDNGVKETLLFGEVDSLRLKNTSSFVFQGFGTGQPIKGLMSKENKLQIGNIVDSSHHLYVITDTAFNLSKNIGVHVHGILGSAFFRNNVVAIDYLKKKIVFARDVSKLGLRMSKFNKLSIRVENDRAYAFVNIQPRDKKLFNQKLLLDLGNSNPMMLFESVIPHYEIDTPSIRDYLGVGFNGAVYGVKNKIELVSFGSYEIPYPIVSYPDTNSYDKNKIAKDRVGSIGNQILSRFYIVFDYPNNVFYLRPNRNFKKAFTLDMSGLEIVHSGFDFVRHRYTNFTNKGDDGGVSINFSNEVNYLIELHANYIIDQVRPKSPAEKVGLTVGDKLLKVNGRRVGKMKLQDIKNKLQSGDGKITRLEIERAGKKIDFQFRLVDPLAK